MFGLDRNYEARDVVGNFEYPLGETIWPVRTSLLDKPQMGKGWQRGMAHYNRRFLGQTSNTTTKQDLSLRLRTMGKTRKI